MVDDAELAGQRRRVQMAFETLSDRSSRHYDGDNSSYPALTVSSQAFNARPSVGIVTSVEQANTTVSHTGEDIRDSDFRSHAVASSIEPICSVDPIFSRRAKIHQRGRTARTGGTACPRPIDAGAQARPEPVVLTPDILAELTADQDITGSLEDSQGNRRSNFGPNGGEYKISAIFGPLRPTIMRPYRQKYTREDL